MKAEELRINNYIQDDVLSNVQVYSIFDSGQIEIGYKHMTIEKDIITKKLIVNLDSQIPIALTEYWLLNFGFINTGTPEHPNYTKGFYKCLWRNGRTNICNSHGFIKNLSYVHELQNLFFALTGEDLTISAVQKSPV